MCSHACDHVSLVLKTKVSLHNSFSHGPSSSHLGVKPAPGPNFQPLLVTVCPKTHEVTMLINPQFPRSSLSSRRNGYLSLLLNFSWRTGVPLLLNQPGKHSPYQSSSDLQAGLKQTAKTFQKAAAQEPASGLQHKSGIDTKSCLQKNSNGSLWTPTAHQK